MRTLLFTLLLASCTSPMQVTMRDASAERPCSVLIAYNLAGGCLNCDVLKPAADADIYTVYIDDVKLWPSSWEIDSNNCLVLLDCDGKPHAVLVETACLPPRH
jgi:hypothetical protein